MQVFSETVYAKKKTNKWGFKVFTRCGVTGMVYNFEVYCGEKSNSEVASSTNLGVTGDFVMQLCENFHNTNATKFILTINLLQYLF